MHPSLQWTALPENIHSDVETLNKKGKGNKTC